MAELNLTKEQVAAVRASVEAHPYISDLGESLCRDWPTLSAKVEEQEKERDALRAQVKRLRDALEQIVAGTILNSEWSSGRIAQEALAAVDALGEKR